MSRKLLMPPATTALALCLAACGSGGSGSSGAGPARAAVPASQSRPTRIYRVKLSGAAETPRGAPHGSGWAIIAFHGDSLVCWRFAHLRGFNDAVSADLHVGRTGHSGSLVVALSTGPRLHHQGCVPLNPAASKAIWNSPSKYYVHIHSKQYPAGAVRAQL
jgi:hypothetical protein